MISISLLCIAIALNIYFYCPKLVGWLKRFANPSHFFTGCGLMMFSVIYKLSEDNPPPFTAVTSTLGSSIVWLCFIFGIFVLIYSFFDKESDL